MVSRWQLLYNVLFSRLLQISSNSNKNPEKVMPTMPKAKTSSLSETDCDEENLFRGKPMVNSVRSSTQQNKESPTSTATTTTASSAPAHSESNNGVTTTTAAPTKRSVNDFRFGKTIGEGSFSTVYLAKDIHTGKEYASTYETVLWTYFNHIIYVTVE